MSRDRENQGTEAVWVDLDEIDARPASEVRKAINGEAVQDYAEVLDRLPPVVLVFDPEIGSHWTADGHHRLLAAKSKRKTQVRATVLRGSYDDALEIAAQANEINGVRITRADREHRAKLVLKRWPERSNRELAKLAGVAPNTIISYRKDLERTVQIAQLPTTVGADGKARPSRRKAKPKPDDEPAPIEAEADDPEPPARTEEPEGGGATFDFYGRWNRFADAVRDEFGRYPKGYRGLFGSELGSLARRLEHESGEVTDRLKEWGEG